MTYKAPRLSLVDIANQILTITYLTEYPGTNKGLQIQTRYIEALRKWEFYK